MSNESGRAASRPKISVVIPAYNEEKTLAGHFDALIPVLVGLVGDDWEIIVFDDGSLDRTAAVVRAYGETRISLLSHHPNRGKGAAVRAGILASQGEAILLCDADMATPPGTLIPFIDALRDGEDIVIGNRMDARSTITRKQSLLRRLLGRGYSWLSTLLTSAAIVDFNCGFKVFRGDIARELLTETKSSRWAYDIEVLTLATRRGYRIAELPVVWEHGDNSTIRLPGAIFTTLREMVHLRARLRGIPHRRS